MRRPPEDLARLPKRERVAIEIARATTLYVGGLVGEALRVFERSAALNPKRR